MEPTPQDINDQTIIINLKDIENIKYAVASPEHVREAINIAIFRGKKTITLKLEEWIAIKRAVQEREDFNNRIQQTAILNNKGIESERIGDLASAIEYYEKNVTNKCVATHSYDRLAIIYKKQNNIEKELWVLDLAIEIFSIENHKRYLRAIDEPENIGFLDMIEEAHQENIGIKNQLGRYIYSPYSIKKYITRSHKIRQINKNPR